MKKPLTVFLLGTFGQIAVVCIIVCILRNLSVPADYTTAVGMCAVAAAGASSAFWGIIVSNRYKGAPVKKIFLDFFAVKVPVRFYFAALLFIAVDFFSVLAGGQVKISHWYLPVLLFLKSIVFGGIEEIGWRYTFQPILEEKAGFIAAAAATFVFWGAWHFLYFYVEGTIQQIQVFPFLAGLLTNCFILAWLYRCSKNLWLCVMTHALINTMAQLSGGGSQYVDLVCKFAIIAAVCVHMEKISRTCIHN